MVAENTSPFLEFGRPVHLALHQYLFSVVLGECVGTECDPSATGLPHCGESDGVGGGLLGEKGVHGSRTPQNTTGGGDSKSWGTYPEK